MNLRSATNRAQKILGDNSPQILTAIAVAGTITTAYFAGTASFKAAEILADEEMAREVKRQAPHMTDVAPMTKGEKFELIWKLYIPAVTSAVTTIGCIVGSNRIGMRRTAAMTAAYALSEIRYDEYREKVVEKMGAKKEQVVREEITQEKFNKAQAQRDPNATLPGRGHTLCFDASSGRTFMSDMETLRKAENDINFQILHSDYATVSDFYDLVGLPETSTSSDLGWNHYKKLDLNFVGVLDEHDNPCLGVEFQTVPIRDPWNYDGPENFRA